MSQHLCALWGVLPELDLDRSALWLLFAIASIGLAVILGFLAWRRSGYQRGLGWLELLRVALIALAAATLLQPELREESVPDEQPVLLVLEDASRSMETEDALDARLGAASPGSADPLARSRREVLAERLPREFWAPLADRVEVHVETFSSEEGVDATDIDRALHAALERYADLRAVVLASDGDWNTGRSPLAAATELRTRGVPIFTVGLGSETPLPDIEVSSLDPPTFSVLGKSLQVPFSVRSTLAREVRTRATLRIGRELELTQDIVIPPRGLAREMFFWTPDELGDVSLELSVPFHPKEVVRDNNSRQVDVTIRAESLEVLVIESFPRWEYRYLRNALERDPGVEVSCLLFHPQLEKHGGGSGYIDTFPATLDALARFDVVFLGDVGVSEGQLTVAQCELLRGLVEQQASGLVFLPGLRGNQATLLSTSLAKLYPVMLDAARPRGIGSRIPGKFLLTESGRRSLLTKLVDEERENEAIWQSLPGFQWRSPALRSRAGTSTLAIDEHSRAPLLVTRSFGTGKVLFMGTDGAWRWREGVEDLYHYRFWGQVARWMAYQRHMAKGEMLRLFYTPERPRVGATVTLHATVLDPSGAPLGDATVGAEVVDPAGVRTKLRFLPSTLDSREDAGESDVDWGLYSARFQTGLPGEYSVTLSCVETGAQLETMVSVGGEVLERVGKPARHEVLREVAEVSRGEWVPIDRLDSLHEKVLAIPEPDPWTTRLQLWASPWWVGILVVLLSVFWIGRKQIGRI